MCLSSMKHDRSITRFTVLPINTWPTKKGALDLPLLIHHEGLTLSCDCMDACHVTMHVFGCMSCDCMHSFVNLSCDYCLGMYLEACHVTACDLGMHVM